MPVRARLRATVPAPLPPSQAGPPTITGFPGRRLLVQRSDEEVVAQALDDAFVVRPGTEVRFPAPWPRRRGTWEVAPDASVAVFAGVHAVIAVEPSGATRWEVRHGCWTGSCREMHTSYEEYADLPDHRYPEGGSVGFSTDGKFVWAHVRGPLTEGELTPDTVDEWLLLDARDGRMLARADAEAAAAGSFHFPHPTDPHQMGLSIGEGQDGAPLRWGRWDGERLHVDCLEGDLCLLGVNPSDGRLMTVSHDQDELAVRDARGRMVDGLEWDAEATVPPHPEAPTGDDHEMLLCWDWAGGFVDRTTLLVSTVECDEEWGVGRHWTLDTAGARELVPVVYPASAPAHRMPAALGDGAWLTLPESWDAVCVWELDRASE